MNIKNLQGPYKHVFMDETEIKHTLTFMEQDISLQTTTDHSDIRTVSFTETHMDYLKKHPKVNPETYLANLRTMLRIRPVK